MTNGGIYHFDQQAKLKLLQTDVHFDQNSLSTVISYHTVATLPNVRIMVDTSVEDVINMMIEDGQKVLIFRPCEEWLYYFDTADEKTHEKVLNTSK